MGYNRRGNFGNKSRRNFGNRPHGNFNRGPRQMYDAICADCGKECKVPFKPTEGRPVYCRECFQKRRPVGQ